MKSTRLNLCVTLRNTLANSGYSTVKAVNAVNAALGELEVSGVKNTVKLGDSRITKTQYKITETETIAETFAGKANSIPLRFDAFNSALAKVEKIATIEAIDLPEVFADWLDKFAKAEKETEKQEA